jgi:NADH-quinone oxidoreductase subunit G
VDPAATYTALEQAAQVILVGFEPEEESPIVFLRLRKAVRKNGTRVVAVAPFASNGTVKLGGSLVAVAPGEEAAALAGLAADASTVILLGERAGWLPGVPAAATALADRSGAALAWVPRRAGDRGAVEAGCLPNLLPGGRPIADATARVDLQAAWGVDSLPAAPGLDAEGILAAAPTGLALVVAGVEPTDFTSSAAALAGLEQAPFVISIEQRLSEVTERADVVFPVALVEEHRRGRVNTVIRQNTSPMTDLRVLAALADALGRPLGVRTAKAALAELDELGAWEGVAPLPVEAPAPAAPVPADGLLLATWRELIDGSRSNDGETALLATAKPVFARVSPVTAADLEVETGDPVTVQTEAGWLTLPVYITRGMADGVVWVPANAPGTPLSNLGVTAGDVVQVSKGGAA